MIKKLLLAVAVTFSLNLFLGVSLPNTSTTGSRLSKAPANEQGSWGALFGAGGAGEAGGAEEVTPHG